MTDTDPRTEPSTSSSDPDDDRPDVVMQVFGFLVAIAFVVIAGTFFYDSFTDIF